VELEVLLGEVVLDVVKVLELLAEGVWFAAIVTKVEGVDFCVCEDVDEIIDVVVGVDVEVGCELVDVVCWLCDVDVGVGVLMSKSVSNSDSKLDTTLLGNAESRIDNALVVVGTVVVVVSVMVAENEVGVTGRKPNDWPESNVTPPRAVRRPFGMYQLMLRMQSQLYAKSVRLCCAVGSVHKRCRMLLEEVSWSIRAFCCDHVVCPSIC